MVWSSVFACTAPAAAQSVRFLKYTPQVLPAEGPEPLRLEVEVTGAPTRVSVDFNPAGLPPSPIEMRDDGAGDDRVAGDSIFTAMLPSGPIRSARTADDVNRVFIGFLNLFSGASNVFRGNLFAEVYTDDAGTYPIVRLDPFLQATTRLVNIHDPGYFATADPRRVLQEFYRWFGDDYDVVNLIYAPQRFANRTHSIIKNTVDGIGVSRIDGSGQFGSNGRLQGISQFPIPGLFDGAETGHLHELGHQWINFLNAPPFAIGRPHWPRSTMATGVMGLSIGGQGGQGGSFPCDITEQADGSLLLRPRTEAPGYNDLDLYLMGLLPPGEVRRQIVFDDQSAQISCTGQAFTGAVTRVAIADVVGQFGPRLPAAGAAPTAFRLATVLVTRDELVSPEAMWLYSWMVDRAELKTKIPTHSGFLKQLGQPFFVATRGLGTLDMRVDFESAPADFALLPVPGVQFVTAGATAEFQIAVEPRGAAFDSEITLNCVPVPATVTGCTFTPATVTPGASGAIATLRVTTRPRTAGRVTLSTTGGSVLLLAWALTGPLDRRRRSRAACARSAAAALVMAMILGPACDGGPRPPQNPNPGPGPGPSAVSISTSIVIQGMSAAAGVEHRSVVTVTTQ
jgi:hypothetical protein